MLPHKGSPWNAAIGISWFIAILTVSTIFEQYIGHYGWHWVPFWLAVMVIPSVYFIVRTDPIN